MSSSRSFYFSFTVIFSSISSAKRSLCVNLDDDPHQSTSASAKPAVHLKRKRGRPRKQPSTSDESSSSDEDIHPLQLASDSPDEETFSDLEEETLEFVVGDYYVVRFRLETGKVPVKHYIGLLEEVDRAEGSVYFDFLRHKKMGISMSLKTMIMLGFPCLLF